MSEAAQAPASDKKQTRGRLKKADAPYTIHFLNEKNETSSRVPQGVKTVAVKGADGKTYAIHLKDIPQVVREQLEADALRKKINFFLKDVTKKDVGRIGALVTEVAKNAKDATLYVAKEGGGPGRSFDYDFWLDVIARTAQIKVKAGNPKAKEMTPKMRSEALLKLQSMTADERKEKQKQWSQDKVFKNAAMQIRAERENAKMTKEVAAGAEADVLSDLF